MFPNLTDVNVIRSEVAKIFAPFKQRLAAMPTTINYLNKTYDRAKAFQSVDGTLWYLAACAVVAPGALKSALGIPYDGGAEVQECDACGKSETYGIEPVTMTLITTIIGAVVALAPIILGALAAVAPALIQTAQDVIGNVTQQNTPPPPPPAAEKEDDNTGLLVLVALAWLLFGGDAKAVAS